MSDDVDELREQIGDLQADQRTDLLQGVQEDRVERYFELREEYLEAVGGLGPAGIYGPDSPMAEYCEEHPDDPICWVISRGGLDRESLAERLELREEYVEKLETEGLLDIERNLVGIGGGRAADIGSPVGMPGPEGWPPRPPGWPEGLPWPPWGPVANLGTAGGRPYVLDPVAIDPMGIGALYGIR